MKKSIAIALLGLMVAMALVAAPIKVGLVTDVGGIDDKSFNQGTWEGVKVYAAEKKLKVGTDVKYLQSSADADYIPNLTAFADQKVDLIIAPGFLFNEAMLTVAKQYPNQKFMIIDSVVADKDGKMVPNVANANFAANEGSFLAGVAAALKAKADKKDTVGFVGGMQFPLIQDFQAGYMQGVKAVFPTCKILVDYSGSFTDAGLGQALAKKQFDAGADVIYQVAGGCGNGVIKEAKERSAKGDIRWAIGVDKDQYNDGVYATGKSCVLTSMTKRVDVAAHDVAVLTEQGKFPGGQNMMFNLKNKGVGLPEKNPNLSAAITAEVKKYNDQIVAGKLIVDDASKLPK